jgi:hypothetical protein
LLSENSEHESEHEGVGQLRAQTCLTRAENTLVPWWEGQQYTWTQRDKKDCGDQQISLGENKIHRSRNKSEEEEEHECVEEHESSVCDVFLGDDTLTISRKDEPRAQCKE